MFARERKLPGQPEQKYQLRCDAQELQFSEGHEQWLPSKLLPVIPG